MSLSSDNFTALIYLRDQARKWKNITFITLIIAFIILIKVSLVDSDDKLSNLSEDNDFIAEIDLDGVIFRNKYRSNILQDIAKKDNIKAVIININSPGGGIVGSEILYKNIKEISKSKPVIAVLQSVAASGGYMTAIAADYIIAHNGTLTGSIGVIIQSTEITEMANKLGVTFNNYKSSQLKGTPSPFEKSNPIVDQAVKDSIEDSYGFFIELVKNARKDKIKPENLPKVTDGRIFTGRQALKLGLVDKIGSEKEALEYLETEYQIQDLDIKTISLKKSENKLLDKIINSDSAIGKFLNKHNSKKQLMAIW